MEENIIFKFKVESDRRAFDDLGGAVKTIDQAIRDSNRKTIESFNEYDKSAQGITKTLDGAASSNSNFGKSMRDLRKQALDSIKDFNVFGLSIGSLIAKSKELITVFSAVRKGLTGTTALSRTQARGVISLSRAFGGSRTAIAGVVRALNIFRVALLSTGIGAIVIALGSLVTFLTQTQKGADLLSQKMAGLRAVFNVIVSAVSGFGETISNAFENPIESIKALGKAILDNVLNRFKALGVFIEAIGLLIEGEFVAAMSKAKTAAIQLATGLDEVEQQKAAETLTEVANAANEARIAAELLDKQLQAVRDARIALDVETAQSRANIRELNKIVEDTTKTINTRIAAAQRVSEIEQNLLAERIALQREEVRILTAQNALPNTKLDDTKALADAEIALASIISESQELQTTNQNKLNTLIDQQKAAVQSLTEAYNTLRLQLDLANEQDPIQRLRIQAIADIAKLEEDKAKVLRDAFLFNTDPALVQRQIAAIDEAIELVKEGVRKGAEEINQIPVLEGFNDAIIRFIETGEGGIERIAANRQFDVLFARFGRLREQIAGLANAESVDDIRLREQLEKELEEAIQLLQDSPFKDAVNELLKQILDSANAVAESNSGFLQKLLGLDDDEFAQFRTAAQMAISLNKEFLDTILQQRVDNLAAQEAAQQSNLDTALSRAADGNAKQVQLETERLNKIQEERAEAVEAQRALAAIEIITAQTTAAANTIKAISGAASLPFPANLVAVPLTVGLLAQIGTAVAAVNGAFNGIPGLYEGTEYSVADTLGRTGVKDGHFVRIDDEERVLRPDLNRKVKGMSSDELVENALKGQHVTDYQVPLSQSILITQPYRMPQEVLNGSVERTLNNQANAELLQAHRALISEMKGVKKEQEIMTSALSKLKINVGIKSGDFYAMMQKEIRKEKRRKKRMG